VKGDSFDTLIVKKPLQWTFSVSLLKTSIMKNQWRLKHAFVNESK